MSEKNIIIIRHFKTFEDDKGNEKILYKKSLSRSVKFVDFIKKYVNENKSINKIKIYTSNQDRTIMTAFILISKLKSEIISSELKNVNIFEPIITDIIDRDPKKNKYKGVCDKIKNIIEPKLKNDTLYVFITHSSLIFNLFECFYNIYTDKNVAKTNKNIHSYSLSFMTKTNNHLKSKFNINMD
jgi:hypothetical protein